MKKVLFIGGHHNSAIPIIKKMLAEKDYSLTFVGHMYASQSNNTISSEYKEVTSLNIPYISFQAPKFYRVAGLYKYLFFIKSLLKSYKILRKEKPDLVFSFGGYMAVPFAISSVFLKIKLVTHEQTTNLGLANLVISKMSNRVFLTWSNDKYKNNQKYIVTGIPLRQEILDIRRRGSFAQKSFFVQGGKQGSHALNQFIFDNIEILSKKYEIFHQTSSHSETKDHLVAQKLAKEYSKYHFYEYVHGLDYTKILNNVDFIISRSGAHFAYEMSYIKNHCIFVPIKWSSRNEQYHNALMSKSYTISTLLDQDNLNLTDFESAVKLLNATYLKKGFPSKKLHPENSLKLIFGCIEELIN